MTAYLPDALASVLMAMERDHIRYVLYREPETNQRTVILVEGPEDAALLRAAFRSAGAESVADDSDGDFILRSLDSDDAPEQSYVVELKSGSGRTSIANLLWLAATSEGAAAARSSFEHDSDH